MEETFFDGGLNFSCQRCAHCCIGFSGVVLLSHADLQCLADWAELSCEQFVQVYCRWIEDDKGIKYLTLKELSNYQCIFWKDGVGCDAYEARPVQCRTYPFWTKVMENQDTWNGESKSCPGINKGSLHSREEILSELKKYQGRECITR